MMRAVTNC